jgi:hypothetical protein
MTGIINGTSLEVSQLYGSLWREDLIGVVEESELLASIIGKRLVTANWKDLACAVVWKFVIVLQVRPLSG